jgi:hypothetical protein
MFGSGGTLLDFVGDLASISHQQKHLPNRALVAKLATGEILAVGQVAEELAKHFGSILQKNNSLTFTTLLPSLSEEIILFYMDKGWQVGMVVNL